MKKNTRRTLFGVNLAAMLVAMPGMTLLTAHQADAVEPTPDLPEGISAKASDDFSEVTVEQRGKCKQITKYGPYDSFNWGNDPDKLSYWRVAALYEARACPRFADVRPVAVEFRHITSTGGAPKCASLGRIREFRSNPDVIGGYNPGYLETPCTGDDSRFLTWYSAEPVRVYRNESAASRCIAGGWEVDIRGAGDLRGSLDPVCVNR